MGNGNNLVGVGSFCNLNDSTLKEHGLNEGDLLYIAGDLLTPISEDDPYIFRKVFIAARVDEGGHILVDEGAFTINGERLDVVSEEEQSRLDGVREKDFAYVKEDEELEATN